MRYVSERNKLGYWGMAAVDCMVVRHKAHQVRVFLRHLVVQATAWAPSSLSVTGARSCTSTARALELAARPRSSSARVQCSQRTLHSKRTQSRHEQHC